MCIHRYRTSPSEPECTIVVVVAVAVSDVVKIQACMN